MDIFLPKFLKNFNNMNVIKGMVIASPSNNNPNYFYHWIRDGAICMNTIFTLYEKKNITKMDMIEYFTNYISVEKQIQQLVTISGLGEPKINVDLTPFNKPWGRPQNDGPALRCIVIMKYYNFLLKDNPTSIIDIDIIKTDLIYISMNYMKPCFDLWEEIPGYHFFTLMVMKKCLEEGMKITNISYNNEISEIEKMLEKFYINEMIISSFNIKWEILREYDSSIILAFLYTDVVPNSSIVNTINNGMIIFKNIYNINRNKLYPLIGRYKDDIYYNGNPWVLTSIAMCRMLNKIDCMMCLDQVNIIFDETPSIIAKSIIDLLKNIIIFNYNDYNLSEQIDKNTGEFIGASLLTWNYSECLQYILENGEF